jgi:hypothetical protein
VTPKRFHPATAPHGQKKNPPKTLVIKASGGSFVVRVTGLEPVTPTMSIRVDTVRTCSRVSAKLENTGVSVPRRSSLFADVRGIGCQLAVSRFARYVDVREHHSRLWRSRRALDAGLCLPKLRGDPADDPDWRRDNDGGSRTRCPYHGTEGCQRRRTSTGSPAAPGWLSRSRVQEQRGRVGRMMSFLDMCPAPEQGEGPMP